MENPTDGNQGMSWMDNETLDGRKPVHAIGGSKLEVSVMAANEYES